MKKYSILFIGNSYTFYNGMPKLLEALAASAGYEVEVDSVTKGGYRLSQLADPENEHGKRVEARLTGEKKYDFVVLQEQSLAPAFANAGGFFDAVRNLAERIRTAGAEPVLYSTWGRETGHPALATYGWTSEVMTWRLAASYRAIGEELGLRVADVGLAFYGVYTGDTGIGVYHTDSTHPSYAGSYLAAATLFAKIFDTGATLCTYFGDLDPETARTLLATAERTVTSPPTIPEEYKVSSVGVHKKE